MFKQVELQIYISFGRIQMLRTDDGKIEIKNEQTL